MRKIILGIETSCDDTAVAVVIDDKLASNIVSSQVEIHTKYGGIMPEIASRLHLENITMVIEEALNKANIKYSDISAIGVTSGPGLIGALHVGLQAAKTLALAYNLPLISVQHLAGHIYANNFIDQISYPSIALIVSGGNSELVYMEKEFSFKVIGQTLDDAIGESIDKVARILGLPYPGGPHIDRLAKLGNNIYKLPMPKVEGLYNFSFSGLKTAVVNLVHSFEQNKTEFKIEDVACSFQNIAMEQILLKTIKAVKDYQVKQIVLGGGVAANSYLRQELVNRIKKEGLNTKVVLPSLWCCMDNAAMIALIASKMYDYKLFSDLTLKANPNYDIETFSSECLKDHAK